MSRNMMIFIVGIVVVLFLAVFKASKKISVPGIPSRPSSTVVPNSSQDLSTPGSQKSSNVSGFFSSATTPGMLEKYSRSRIMSDKAKEEFMSLGKVEVKFPDSFKFRPLDMDFDKITGIYARSEKMEVAVMAGRILPTEKELIEFLRSNDTGVPNIDGKNISFVGNAVDVPAMQGSGLKTGKYWIGRTSDHKGVRVGLVERADGKGSYLFVFTDSEDKLDNLEDFYEGLYKTLKVLPE